MPVTSALPPELRDAVLAWYESAGRRFAIRESTDPYAILVSEVMAQQTQIGRASDYWQRWMQQFPTVVRLAAASPAQVLRAWAGLGYNRRAINLQRAARAIVTDHGGRLPDTVEVLQTLPGIGPYTARAVAAIAFGMPVGAVDTNVRRVLSRVSAGDRPLPAAELQALADASVPRGRARAWTHAVMDVGATFCRSRRPRCEACPALAWCRYAASARPQTAARRARGTPAGSSFAGTSRWLRGRILARLRDLPDGAWTAFRDGIGAHGPVAIAQALTAMSRDGLIELDIADGTRARLPIG